MHAEPRAKPPASEPLAILNLPPPIRRDGAVDLDALLAAWLRVADEYRSYGERLLGSASPTNQSAARGCLLLSVHLWRCCRDVEQQLYLHEALPLGSA